MRFELAEKMIAAYKNKVATLPANDFDRIIIRKRVSHTLCSEIAEQFGCNTATDGGIMNFGVIIADQFVLKIVGSDDAAYSFLRQVYNKDLRSKHFPKVWSFIVCHNVAIVVMEKLVKIEEPLDVSRKLRRVETPMHYKLKAKDLPNKLYSDFWKLGRDKGWRRDCHSGNIMQRKDGTIVLFDPVAS